MEFDYKSLIEHIYDGLYFVDKERRIIFWNKAAERITGFTSEEVMGTCCMNNILMHVDQSGENLCQGMCPLAETIKDGVSRDAEVYLQHKDGHRVPVWVRVTPLRDSEGKVAGGAELFTDLSAQNTITLKIKELESLSFLDTLTQLANRRYIELELEGRFAEMVRYGLPFGILFIDIDYFKIVNDIHGHHAGDLVLKTVSRTLLSAVRPFDLVGRWGGEEFIGIVRNVDYSILATIGNRIRSLVEKTRVKFDKETINVTISIGATLAMPQDNLQSLVKRADALLYQGKEKGRNCLVMDQQSGHVPKGAGPLI